MPIFSPSFKIGNVSTPKPIKQASGNFIDSNSSPSDPVSPGTKVVSDVFNSATLQGTPNPFDVSTGIISESPEIVAFTDFIPIYKNDGSLTDFGQLLQSKQDSMFVNAKSSIKSIIDLPEAETIDDKIKENKKFLLEFFNLYGKDVNKLLFDLDVIRKKFDIRYPLDSNTLQSLGFGPTSKNFYGAPLTVEEFLVQNKTITKNWTATKAWLQICMNLKKSLREGAPLTFTALPPPNFTPDTMIKYKDAYSIVVDNDSKSHFSYSTISTNKVPNIFGTNSNLGALISTEIELDKVIGRIQKSFSNFWDFSIFNQSFFSESTNIDDSIARLAHLISKEFIYSTKLKKEFSSTLSTFGYTLSNVDDNKSVWDFLIGQVGKDITDINPSPLGGGNSMVSLSQFIEPGGTEVLTFEDKYISDNIGTRNTGIMTPGTYYYLESALNSQADGFDTARITSLISRLKTSSKLINDIIDNLSFKKTPAPYGSLKERANAIVNKSPENVEIDLFFLTGDNNSDPNATNAVDPSSIFLSNPLSLIRKIQETFIAGGDLSIRDPGPRLWTNTSNGTISSDLSPLLISTAIEDVATSPENSNLLSLIFLHISMINKGFGYGDLNSNSPSEGIYSFGNDGALETPQPLVSVIENVKIRLKNKFSLSSGEIGNKANKKVDFSLFDKLLEVGSAPVDNKFLMILKISNFIKTIDEFLDSAGIYGDTGQGTGEEKTAYSGVTRTTYIMSIFLLCCMIIHAANPERIAKISNIESFNPKLGLSGNVPLTIVLSYNPVIKIPAGTSDASKVSFGENKSASEKEVKESKPFNALVIDQTLNKSENLIYSYNKRFLAKLNTINAFITTLKIRLTNLKTSLDSPAYSAFLTKTNQILQDPAQTRRLMTQEQMSLVSANIADLRQRLDENYVSPIKDITPYFDSLKQKSVDNLLPIEDLQLVTWSLFLKQFFKDGEYGESKGWNKKIISVGIPQQMYRRLKVDASGLASSTLRNNIVTVNVYRIDTLRPDLIHLPIKFLFDLRRYPTKNLASFLDAVDVMNGKKQIDFNRMPSIETSPMNGESKLIQTFVDSFKDLTLSTSDKESLYQNHLMSQVMEEYIRFVSDLSFSENFYNEYSSISAIEETEADRFMLSTIKKNPLNKLNPSIEKFFYKNSLLKNDLNAYIRKVILPKKFDRVFHVVFDPDDFFINTDPVTGTSPQILEQYKKKRVVEEVTVASPGGGAGITQFQRVITNKNQVTFDKYFVAIEAYNTSV